jgi:hypothetical protein
MQFDLDKFLSALDRPPVINWIPEMKNGIPVYKWLMENLPKKELNENQTRNAIHALYRLRTHGDVNAVLDVLVECAVDTRIAVRSEAVQVAIGLVRFGRTTGREPQIFSREQISKLNAGIAMGLDQRVAELLEHLI